MLQMFKKIKHHSASMTVFAHAVIFCELGALHEHAMAGLELHICMWIVLKI